jgi:hypothetical protein
MRGPDPAHPHAMEDRRIKPGDDECLAHRLDMHCLGIAFD